jgi:hypothetical protein
MKLRFTALLSRYEARFQQPILAADDVPVRTQASAPFGGFGAATGAAALRPGPPSSVAPSGIGLLPIDDDSEGETAEAAPVTQRLEVPPESPPPSNSLPVGDGPPAAAQLSGAAPGEAAAGLIPGEAISVDPSGMPAGGTVDPDTEPKGDVAPMPVDGGVSTDTA